ncbi:MULTISPECIES: hypothetical protein [unclassified Pseudoalteromonas]|uniref:hypothetical protein n=1 Tax=unclassified Pseudoalteromonas TaxID=194690 RepID=UPI0009777FCA|nr:MULTISPECIES: hypothetical protein [unclassified Pseudoalteromonas]UOB73966.1 hypothetical protein MTP24_02145 [Pseudoalteromonas sp. APM04]
MSIKRKLFVIIQPLQYLQALELLQDCDENILIIPWANENNQLHKLVDKKIWNKVFWIKYSGTAVDIVKNNKAIKQMLKELGAFDEILISAYYNEFMNLIANSNPLSNKVLLEDGNATLLIDSSKHYKSIKFRSKYIVCKILGFDIRPIDNATLVTLDRKHKMATPLIAKNIIVNDFRKLQSEVVKYDLHNSVYFISSAFINAGMISRENYINFLLKLAKQYEQCEFKIVLHRFDKKTDFTEFNGLSHVEVIESTGPIELYFKDNMIKPLKVITAGSGATETLELIYGFDVNVVIPKLECFYLKHRKNMELLIEHFQVSHHVELL